MRLIDMWLTYITILIQGIFDFKNTIANETI